MNRWKKALNVLINLDQEDEIIETAAYALPEKDGPGDFISYMRDHLESEEFEVFAHELKIMLQELDVEIPPHAFVERAEKDFYFDPINGEEFRKGDKLSFNIIERMLKSGVVRFPLEMKRAQLVQIFRNPRKWKVICRNDKLREVVTANLIELLPKMADEFTFSAMVYGSSFAELTAEIKTEGELGLEVTPGPQKFWTVFKQPLFINPTTVKHIKRTRSGKFDGFVQFRQNLQAMGLINVTDINTGIDINIQKDEALIIPYNDKFGDLWGESYYTTIYPYWFWFEVVLRAMVRYMERMSSPVAVARAPSKRKIRVPGTETLQDAMLWALSVARDIATSNAAVLPSDVDPQTEKPIWSIEYLTAPERSGNFKEVLEQLQELIFRAAMTGDRAFTQSSGGTGSRSIGEVHAEATLIHNEMILIGFLWYINKFFMPKYSLWNMGHMGPTVRLETVGLSREERDVMMKLLATAGNSKVVQEFFHIINWRELAEQEGIPAFNEEEVEENKKKLLNEEMAKERRRRSIMTSDNGAGSAPTPAPNPFVKASSNGSAETQRSNAGGR